MQKKEKALRNCDASPEHQRTRNMMDDGQRVDSTGHLTTGSSFDALDTVTLGYMNGARGDFTCQLANNGVLFDRGLTSEILTGAAIVLVLHSGTSACTHSRSSPSI